MHRVQRGKSPTYDRADISLQDPLNRLETVYDELFPTVSQSHIRGAFGPCQYLALRDFNRRRSFRVAALIVCNSCDAASIDSAIEDSLAAMSASC